MAARRNAPAQDVTPFVLAGGVAGVGVAMWFGYPGLPVLWAALLLAVWMVQPPALTGKKDTYGYPTAANSAEERRLASYRMAKDLQTALILPTSDMLPGLPPRIAWFTSLWAAVVGWLIPVIGTRSLPQSDGHLLDAVAAFLLVAAVGGAKRRSVAPDNPGTRLDSLGKAFRDRGALLVVAGCFGMAFGVLIAAAVTIVVARFGAGFGASSLVLHAAAPSAHRRVVHPGISFPHPALVWLVFAVGGMGAGVWAPWSTVALAEWKSLFEARTQWGVRWAALKYEPGPVLTNHKVIEYPSESGSGQVIVDTFSAPAHIGATEFYGLEKKLDPMIGTGVRTAVLSCPDTDRGAPLSGTWSGVEFTVAIWPVTSPPDITQATEGMTEELALLWIRSGLAWVCRALGGTVEPALVSAEQVADAGERTAEARAADQAFSEDASPDNGLLLGVARRLRKLLVQFWEQVKVPPGDGQSTLAMALAAEDGEAPPRRKSKHEPESSGPAAPAVWATTWQFPSNLGAKYLRDNGLGELAEELRAPVVVDHRNDTIYVGYTEEVPGVDDGTKATLDGLIAEDLWRGRWTSALKQGANIPRVQPKVTLDANLANGSVVHRAAFVINQGNSVSEYMGMEANLASALNGATFVTITGWSTAENGGRPGDRHPQALCVYWSHDPVPLTPKWLVPTISPANRWVLNGIVNKVFQTAKLPRPEVVSVRALTTKDAAEHIWEVGIRLYDGVTTADVRSKGRRIAEDLAVSWVRVTDAEDGCTLYFGATPTTETLADPADMDRVMFLDWEQAFLESGVRGSNGVVPQLIGTSYLPSNPSVAVLEFSLPPGLDVAVVRAATAKLRTATGNAYIDVAPSEHGPTQMQVRASRENPLPALVPFQFDAADRVAGLAFATGVDGEPVVFDTKVSAHVAVIGQSGSGKSVCMQGLAYCAVTKGADLYVVDPMKAAADFKFLEPYARAAAVTIPDAAAVLRAVYAEVEQRKKVNADYGVGSYADLPDDVRPAPIIVVVDEFTSLITAESPPRTPFDDPDLEADRLQQIATRNEQRTIGTMIGKIAREARSAGVTLVLGTQKLMAKSLDEVPGGGDLKDLSLDTRVPVPVSDRFPTGWASIGELQLGDQLYTPDGTTAPVIGLSDVFHHRDIYEVRFSDGRTVKTGPHHLWLVSDQRSRQVSAKPESEWYQRAGRLDKADVAANLANTIPVGTWMSPADIGSMVGLDEASVRQRARKLNLPCMVEGNDGNLYPHTGTKPHGRNHHSFMCDKAIPILDGQLGSAATDILLNTHGRWMTADELSAMVFGEQPKVSQIKAVRHQLMAAGCPYIDGRAPVLYEATETFTALSRYWRGLSGVDVATGHQANPERLMTTVEMMEALSREKDVGLAVEVASPIVGAEATLPCDPYTLGVWLGDGSLGSGNITSSDAESCTDEFGFTDQEHILSQLNAVGYGAHRMACDEKLIGTYGLLVRLREAGVLHDKHIPHAYLRASFDQRLALLQGLMDTDGSVLWNGGCTLTQVNKRIAEGARELIESLGIRCGWSERDGGYTPPGSTEKKTTKRVYNLSFRTDLPCFRLPRKLAKQRPPNKSGVCKRRFVKAVTRIPGEPTRCISVDHPEHLFLVDGFVPTHNSNLARILLGVASPGERMSALRVFDQAPDLGTPVPKGRGIWESAVASGVIIQTWFAPAQTLGAELAKRAEPVVDKLDLGPFYRKGDQAPGVVELPADAEPVEIELGEVEFSLDDLEPEDGPVLEDPLEPEDSPAPSWPSKEFDWGPHWDGVGIASGTSPVPDDDPFADSALEAVAGTKEPVVPDDDPFA